MTTFDYGLHGKTIFVTGAASGIGRDIATTALDRGATVVVADRDRDALAQLGAQLGSPDRVIALVMDVTDEAAVETGFSELAGKVECLHGLVNCAGVPGRAMPLGECPTNNWHATIAVNLTGNFLVCRAAVPLLLKAGKSSVVNFSSIAGIIAVPNQAPYIASKWGVIGLTKSLAIDYAAQGLRANAVCPGGTRTPMLAEWVDADPSRSQFLESAHPLGRLAEPRDMTEAALWLVSDASSFITGVVLPVDGGFTLS